MLTTIRHYYHWLHGQWPAGTVERLPIVQPDGATNVPGLYVVGDLSGVPLLKFSADTGTRAVRTLASDPGFRQRNLSDPQVVDVAIIGAGVSGFAAALEARQQNLSFTLIEASEPFSTIENFPKGKPIYTYPTDMTPEGQLQFHDKSQIKEGLLEDLHEQTLAQGIKPRQARVDHVRRKNGVFELTLAEGAPIRAHRVIVAIGRSGNYRKLDVPGEEHNKVSNRLHDPADFSGQDVLVVGGGDSALEAAIALSENNARVTLSYRKAEFTRPKPENVQRAQALSDASRLTLMMASRVHAIDDHHVSLTDNNGQTQQRPNDAVFAMTGREAPLDFFRRSGVSIAGERHAWWWASLILMLTLFTFLYQWKKSGTWLPIAEAFSERNWFPHFLPDWFASLGGVFTNPANPIGTFVLSSGSPGFWYSILYCLLIVIFGIRRIQRRRTPYVFWQTLTLTLIQCVPLFLLPYILLPWLGHLGAFDAGLSKTIADSLFPAVDYDPHGREYWRAFGLILAWPLFLWNVFTSQPLWGWLIISLVQTFVLIPIGIYYFGKGFYCGWICSCGAMAETLGDTHRHKMPHGPFWNRLNMIGQVFLWFALFLLFLRMVSWWIPGMAWAGGLYNGLLSTSGSGGFLPILNYAWFVDLLWAGILGFGLYFHFSGRVWCRFACPLAALMHIYGRFSRFAIITEKKKCISCNVCTSVCHQGIDIMSFANKGNPMQDPECVRCSACVQMCPTGVLSFGQVTREGQPIAHDPEWLSASRVRTSEAT